MQSYWTVKICENPIVQYLHCICGHISGKALYEIVCWNKLTPNPSLWFDLASPFPGDVPVKMKVSRVYKMPDIGKCRWSSVYAAHDIYFYEYNRQNPWNSVLHYT